MIKYFVKKFLKFIFVVVYFNHRIEWNQQMSITLRPHQVNAITDVNKRFTPKIKNILCVLPTGAGKSLTLADYARNAYQKGEPCIVFAHRDVLITQLSEALCKMGVRHTFLCAAKTQTDITNKNLQEFGDSFYEPWSPVILSSTPTFAKRLKDGKLTEEFLQSVKWWLQDECFPAGTMVDNKPIEQIEIGDYVTSFNEKTLSFEKKRVTNIFVNDGHDTMCVIKFSHGEVITCTLNHPILTEKGWKPAFLIDSKDKVLKYENSPLSHLRKSSSTRYKLQKIPFFQNKKGLLFNGMFVNIPFSGEFGNNVEHQQEIRIGKNEKQQSDEKSRVYRENEKDSKRNRSQTSHTGWEWKTADRGRNGIDRKPFSIWIHTTDCSKNKRVQTSDGLSTVLQSGLWKQTFKDSDRSGWCKSLFDREKKTRQEKRPMLTFYGVESVEIFKRGHTDENGNSYDFDKVFNLEVEDNHNYLANGFVVHNCHHTVEGNQWHRCLTAFPNAQGIGFTATPIRGDKKGLGSHCDGVFDDMSVTVNTFDLIKLDMLSPYKVYCTSRVDTTGVKKDSDGDFNKNQLYIKTKEADITGDAVEQYLKHLNGKPVITFCINIEHAKEVAAEFTARGIPSVAVSSKTALSERQRVLAEFKAGKWLNLVNVDLFGEGYDCPAISGVIMLRKTASFSLYKQQFGRMLRKADGKLFGVLIDHVGNTQSMMVNYGLSHPHDDPAWTLDREIERKKSNTEDGEDDGPVETMECQECHYFGVVGEDFIDGVCPECGHKETEEEQVKRVREIKTQAGELIELPMDAMNELIAKREEMYKPVRDFAQNISDHFAYKRQAVNNHVLRQSALDILRYHIQEWSEKHWKESGKSHKLIQMDFESTFGINILKAQAMTASQMNDLTMRIKQCLVAV